MSYTRSRRLLARPARPPERLAKACILGAMESKPARPEASEPVDRIESLPLGERWFPDAFATMSGPGGFALRQVDMSRAKVALKTLRDARLPATFTHIIVRAAALALARNPELHQLV